MNTPHQRLFENDDDYRERLSREADERTIERNTDDAPSQRLFESDEDYRQRIEEEADESIIEHVTDNAPSQRLFEKGDDYRDRISLEADEREIEDATGNAPSQRLFESDSDYRDRVSIEADESVIEKATGSAPSQRLFESDEDYSERISEEANEHRASSEEDSSGGCFLTTACVEFVGLPDDCYELTTLRRFRDNYIADLPNGKTMISEYYLIAPRIVSSIAGSPLREKMLNETWSEVQRAVSAIEAGDNGSALETYLQMIARLKHDVLETNAPECHRRCNDDLNNSEF